MKQAARLAPSDHQIFCRLGHLTKDKKYAARALQIQPDYARAWYLMGELGGGVVNGHNYTEEKCYLKALELDPEREKHWIAVANPEFARQLFLDPPSRYRLGTLTCYVMATAMNYDADNWSEMMRLYERERELQARIVEQSDEDEETEAAGSSSETHVNFEPQLVDARDRGMMTLVRDTEMNTTSASYPAEPPSEERNVIPEGEGDAGDDDEDDVDPAFLDLFVQDPTLRTSLRDRRRDIEIEHDEHRLNYFNMGFPQYNEVRHAAPSRGDVVHTHDGEPYVYDPAAFPQVGDEDD